MNAVQDSTGPLFSLPVWTNNNMEIMFTHEHHLDNK